MAKVRITVVKRALHEELVEKYIQKERYPNGYLACPHWAEGQTFVVEGFPVKPDDFPCDWAWSDIQRDLAMVLFGADLPWMANPGKAITCCSDGFRPVSFLIERIDT